MGSWAWLAQGVRTERGHTGVEPRLERLDTEPIGIDGHGFEREAMIAGAIVDLAGFIAGQHYVAAAGFAVMTLGFVGAVRASLGREPVTKVQPSRAM